MDEILALLRQDAPAILERLVSWNLDLPALTLEVLRACPQADVLDICYRSLRQLSILDPTCGTGAFLRAVLPLLQDLYTACLERMEALVAEPSLPALYRHAFQIYLAEAGPPALRAYTSLQWIIDHNLYGVDLNAEAVEVCQLQLCLKLIALRPTHKLADLPDHFGQHIRVGNSLLGSLSGNSARETRPETGSSQQSFRWDQAFPTPMERGGFDVVIGNPPYVEYKRVRHLYTLDGYTTLETDNLYALTMERAAHLLAPGGRFGMIVPSSATCTDGYRPLQELLLAQQELHVASFSDQRGHLFPIPHPRLCIILYTKNTPSRPENLPASTSPDSSSPTPVLTRSDNAQDASVPPTPSRVFATPYIKLDAETRTSLFEILSYTEVTSRVRPGLIPRYGSPLELVIDSKLALQKCLLGSSLQRKGGYPIYFTRKLSWYVQVTPFIPRILDAQGQVRLPSELKCLRFSELHHARIAFAALNSHLFYWLITTGSDCRNLNMREVRGLPLDLASIRPALQKELCQLADELECDLLRHARMKPMVFQSQGSLTIQCLYPARSKHLIDEIDRALARHYTFNQQELDFLLHYDEEYR